MKKQVLTVFLALLLLLAACSQNRQTPATVPETEETAQSATVPETTEEPTTEPTAPAAVMDTEAVSEEDIIHAAIESAEIDENRHLIVTNRDQTRRDAGYIGGKDTTEGYTVCFLDYDGTPVKVELVEKGGNATPPNEPKHTDMDFLAWEGNWENIQGNTVITASYTAADRYYTVRYCAPDGTLLCSQRVKVGSVPAGFTPTPEEGTVFAGWDGLPLSDGLDTTLTARFVAADEFAVALSSAAVKAGENAELTVSLRGCTDLAGISLALEIPEQLALEAYSFAEDVGGMGTGPEKLPKSGTVKFNWFTIEKSLSDDALLLNLTVSVPADAPAGEYWIRMNPEASDLVSSGEEDLIPEWIMGRITVTRDGE